MTRSLLSLALFAVLLAACHQKKPVAASTVPRFGGMEPADSLFFSLERTPCFGRCPTFKLQVYRDGRAILDGRQNIDRIGRFRTHVPVDIMEKLLASSEEIGFWGLPDSYDGQVTDLPSAIVRVVSGARDHQVRARYNVPPSFDDYVDRNEAILMALPWKEVYDDK